MGAQQKVQEGRQEVDSLGREVDDMAYVTCEIAGNLDSLDQRGDTVKAAAGVAAAERPLGVMQRILSAVQRKESLDEIKRDYSVSRDRVSKYLATAGVRVDNLDFDSITTKEDFTRAVFSQVMSHVALVADAAGDEELTARARAHKAAAIHSPEQAQNIITDLTNYINEKYSRR